MHRKAAFYIALGAATSGCRLMGGVQLTEIATASGKPSNVATILTVSQRGQPVSNLGTGAFRLSENGKVLDSQAVDLRLLDPARIVGFHSVLLLDMSHATTNEERAQFSEALTYFIRNVRVRQSLTVLGFDGSPKPRLIGEFPIDVTGAGIRHLEKQFRVRLDPSRDLRSAVMHALDLLDDRLKKSARPVSVGTLVVFARGPDVAGRVPASQFEARLSRSRHKMVLVNVVGDPNDDQSPSLWRDGKIQAQAVESLPIAFDQAASTVDKLSRQYYLVSYCSPARAGERRLRFEVDVVNDDLQVETGALEAEFNASGFTAGCDSNDPPRFTGAKLDTSQQR